MEVPKLFFQNTKFVDPLVAAITKVEGCLSLKRGLKRKTAYDEIFKYAKQEVENFKTLSFGEDWLLNRVFTAKDHKNVHVSYMVGVYPQHDKGILLIFAREISDIIHLHGFKDEIVDYIILKIIDSLPKRLSRKYKVKKKEENYIINKK